MLAAHLLADEVAAAYRAIYEAAAPPYVMVANAIEADAAAALRAALATAGDERFDVADRARYRWNATLAVPELWSALTTFASAVSGAPLAVAGARWLRFARGDYALVKDDTRTRPPATTVELVLDLSTTVTTDAEMVYAEDDRALSVPQLPQLLSIVGRGPASTRYDRPLTHRAGDAEVVRLRLWLSPRAAPDAAPPTAR